MATAYKAHLKRVPKSCVCGWGGQSAKYQKALGRTIGTFLEKYVVIIKGNEVEILTFWLDDAG
jgi:hypothetical protein